MGSRITTTNNCYETKNRAATITDGTIYGASFRIVRYKRDKISATRYPLLSYQFSENLLTPYAMARLSVVR